MVICRNGDTKVPLSLRGARFLVSLGTSSAISVGARGLPRTLRVLAMTGWESAGK